MNVVARQASSNDLPWPQLQHARIVERGGIRWHVHTMGRGPGLLLLHGTGASNHSFRELMPILASRFTVVAPDLPGHGMSTAPPLFEPTLPDTAAALAELMDEIGFEAVVAVGHSAGAAVIARMTLDSFIAPRLLVGLGAALVPFRGLARAVYPRTAKLLALASKVVNLRVCDHDAVDRLLRSTGSRLDSVGVELYRRLSERPAHVAAVLAMMASWDLDPLYDELPNLRVPFLLLAGDGDRAIPLPQLREAVARTSEGRLRVVAGTGHLLHEEQPATIARVICDEFDGVARGKGPQWETRH